VDVSEPHQISSLREGYWISGLVGRGSC